MRSMAFVCDLCGRALEQHGDRYTVRLSKVPALRQVGERPYDLCPQCAGRLRSQLGRHDGYVEVKTSG